MSYDVNDTVSGSKLGRGGTVGLTSLIWVRVLDWSATQLSSYRVGGFGDDWLLTGNFLSADGIYCGATQDNQMMPMYSGADTSWIFACSVAEVGVGVHFFWRKEGDSTLQSGSIADAGIAGGAGPFLFNVLNILPYHQRLGLYKEWTQALTPDEILAESASSAPVVTAGCINYLPCVAPFPIGEDESGAGNDWTVTGTITLNADQPLIALPSANNAPFLASA